MTPQMNRLDRAIGLIPWVLAAVFGAVAIHLVAILALPSLAPGSAYRRFARTSPVGQLTMLPRAAPGGDGPTFADPFAALAICRFDLSKGPLRLRAHSDGDRPFSVSVRLADGTIIYSANDRQTPKGIFDIQIVTQGQADAQDSARDEADQGDGADNNASPTDDELRLISPGKTGFALFRALSLREGGYEAATGRTKIECAIEKPTP